jgi:RNA polymerase sigma factor (sigma-70 family)
MMAANSVASCDALIAISGGRVTHAELEETLIELDKQVGFWTHRSNGLLDYEDAQAFAYLALVEALNSYRPTHGAGFKHYAKLRMRWGLIDMIRSHSTNVSARSAPFDEDIAYRGGMPGAQEASRMLDMAERAFDKLSARNKKVVWEMLSGEPRDDIAEHFGLSHRQLNRIYKNYVDSIDDQ